MDNSNQVVEQPGNDCHNTRGWQVALAAIRGWSAGVGRALVDLLLGDVLHHQ